MVRWHQAMRARPGQVDPVTANLVVLVAGGGSMHGLARWVLQAPFVFQDSKAQELWAWIGPRVKGLRAWSLRSGSCCGRLVSRMCCVSAPVPALCHLFRCL